MRIPHARGLACAPLWLGLGLLLMALAGVTGCDHGVQWELRSFEDAQDLARKSGKLTFVYFRSWYLVDCTNFEENVLKNPEVLLLTRGMVCVPLDFDWDQPLAHQWNLQRVPAFAIIAPSGDVLARQQAPLTLKDLLAAFHQATSGVASTTQPALPAVTMPP